MSLNLSSLILLVVGLTGGAAGYKMLVTSVGISGSQNLLMYRLAEMLAERGHEVTVLKMDVLPEAKTAKLKKAKEVVFPLIADKEVQDIMRHTMSSMPWAVGTSQPFPIGAFYRLLSAFPQGCRNFTEDPLLAKLRAEKFDVAIVHFLDICSMGLMPHLGIKAYVQASTAFMIDFMAYYSGVPNPSSWVVGTGLSASPPLTIPQRLQSLGIYTAMSSVFRFLIAPKFTSVLREKYGPEYPHLNDIYHATSAYYVNSDPFFEYPRPILHNIVYIGGVTMESPEPLKEDFARLVNESKDGVVLFSLGSVADTRTMPREFKLAFLRAFARFPSYTFIWRLEGEFPEAAEVPNVHLSTWLPQRDLLGSPRLKAFITHGGYNSLTEATYHGVPLLMFPLFGDQYSNVIRVERLGVGVRLEKAELSEDTAAAALKAVLGDAELQARADRLGRMIRRKPVSSYDQAMKWAEFLAEFGPPESLLPDSRNLNLVSYYLLDGLAILGLILALGGFLLCRLCACCCRRCCCRSAHSKPKRD